MIYTAGRTEQQPDQPDQPDQVDVLIESAAAVTAELDAGYLTRLLGYALRHERAPAPAVVTLLITDDPGIQALHRDFMANDTPTDVLSFAAEAGGEEFPMDPGAGHYLGDIAVSWDTAAAQGPEAGMTAKEEVAFLALHGLLHLLGTDDATDDDRTAMLAKQAALLAQFHETDAGAGEG